MQFAKRSRLALEKWQSSVNVDGTMLMSKFALRMREAGRRNISLDQRPRSVCASAAARHAVQSGDIMMTGLVFAPTVRGPGQLYLSGTIRHRLWGDEDDPAATSSAAAVPADGTARRIPGSDKRATERSVLTIDGGDCRAARVLPENAKGGEPL